MIIIDIKSTILRLPEVYPIGDGTQDALIVQVITDEGLIGIGEAHTSPSVIKAVIEAPISHYMARGLKEVLVGRDPRDINLLWDDMYKLTSVFGRRGVVIHAISAIDIALWDLLGKIANQPIYRLLGGAYRKTITAYASILALDTIEDCVKKALDLKDRGYKAVKFGWNKIGSDIERDIEIIREVREAVGTEMALMIDVGVPLPFHKALKLARGLEKYNVSFLEEPLSPDDWDGYARLAASTTIPIAAGEKETTRYGFMELIQQGKIGIIQPDLARAGGFTECLRIAQLAEVHGVTVVPHCWSTDILVAATLHFIASLRECPYIEFCVIDNPIRNNVITKPIIPKEGMVHVCEAPGLGIELNEEILLELNCT